MSAMVCSRTRAAIVALMVLLGCWNCTPSSQRPPVLLFTGAGTSRTDAAALESVLRDAHIAFATADARQLGALSEGQLLAYQLLIVPGGNFEQMGAALSPTTIATIRHAVGAGLNYVGICAGAFLAGNAPLHGLNLTGGVRFGFYEAEARGIRKAAVLVARAGAPAQMHYWEDGPQLSGWGDVIGKYPDGTPAIVEGTFGNGRVLLTGTHPEAPESWRRGLPFSTPATESRGYAATLIKAALFGPALEHF